MRIWLLSDLHVDVCPWAPESIPDHDVLVVAGDVRDRLSTHALPWLARTFGETGRPVVYVPGNHDFYRANYAKELDRAPGVAASLGIHLLVDGSDPVVIDGTRFVGGTLWSDFRVTGDRVASMAQAGRVMNDYRMIRSGPSYRRVSPEYMASMHSVALSALRKGLAEPHDGPTVVVTHHAPSPLSLDSRLAREPLDGAYASDLSALIEEAGPDTWIHGHLHESKDYVIGGTRVVSNPRGYVTEMRMGRSRVVDVENPAFEPGKVIEVHPSVDAVPHRVDMGPR